MKRTIIRTNVSEKSSRRLINFYQSEYDKKKWYFRQNGYFYFEKYEGKNPKNLGNIVKSESN